MRRAVAAWVLAAVGVCMLQAPAFGQTVSATGTISSQQIGTSPNTYKYSLTLTDTGTTPIGTFWFGWIPAYDLLPTAPLTITSPTGWTGLDAPDSFGVASAQWVNTTTPLQPGHTLSGFSFTSTDSPAVIGGTSDFFGLPVNETYVYAGAPELGAAGVFQPTTVVTPEPASLALLPLALGGLLVRRKRK